MEWSCIEGLMYRVRFFCVEIELKFASWHPHPPVNKKATLKGSLVKMAMALFIL